MTRLGLSNLEDVSLDDAREAFLAAQAENCRGPAPWRKRKLHELRTLVALDQTVPRLRLMHADVRTEWHALVALECPVPCRALAADQEEALGIVNGCHVALTYPQKAMSQPLPGYAFAGILVPRPVWHPHVSADNAQRVCLGTTLPVCTPILQILLGVYGALGMQNVRIDPRDPAGVLNRDAALWWMNHPDRMPLTDEPFLPLDLDAPQGERP